MTSPYARKSSVRPVRKRCEKCAAVGYYKPGARRCRYRRFGVGSYCCWGTLSSVAKRGPSTEESAGERFRKRAAREAQTARRNWKVWSRRVVRAEKILRKWRLRLKHAEQKALYSDAQVDQIVTRAKHAASVRALRHRIAKAAGVES